MQLHIARTLIAAVLSIPVGLAVVPSASAAPTDVTYAATTTGNSITNSFANNFVTPINCRVFGFDRPYFPGATEGLDYESLFDVQLLDIPAASSESVSVSALPDGDVWVEWVCGSFLTGVPVELREFWGTPNLNPGLYPATAETTVIRVDSAFVPDTPDETCTGSVCLPSGSFGF